MTKKDFLDELDNFAEYLADRGFRNKTTAEYAVAQCYMFGVQSLGVENMLQDCVKIGLLDDRSDSTFNYLTEWPNRPTEKNG